MAVRQGDARWLNVVKWTHYAMVNAEELGVSQETLLQAMISDKAEVRRLVGLYGGFGKALGLSNDWVVRIIRHVGNYGEAFARNLGTKSDFAIPRDLNDLWDRGGISIRTANSISGKDDLGDPLAYSFTLSSSTIWFGQSRCAISLPGRNASTPVPTRGSPAGQNAKSIARRAS